MEHEQFGSTRFLYKRDTHVFAEIEVVGIDDSLYKFVIYPTKYWEYLEDFQQKDQFDSLTLPLSCHHVNRTFDEQLTCLRAAIRFLSSLRPSRLTPHGA